MYARMCRIGIISGLMLVAGVALAIGGTVGAQSAPSRWEDVTGAIMNVHEQPQVTRESWYTPDCEPHMAIVEDYGSRSEHEVCVVSSSSVQLGVYVQSPGGQALYALKRAPDEVFHRITNLTVDPSKLVLLPDDTVLGASQSPSDTLAMYSLTDVQERLVEVPIPGEPSTYNKLYQMDLQAIEKFVDSNNQTFPVRAIAVSNNRKFAAVQSLGRGIVRVNLETREVKRISDDTTDQLNTVLAVSNDGQLIAVTGGTSAPHRIYTELDDCGSGTVNTAFADYQRCYAPSFAVTIDPELEDAVVYRADFSVNGNFTAYTWSEHAQQARTLEFSPDPSSYRLDYLALGDSYSSGEGDVGRKSDGSSYYLPGTERNGRCHLSSRSYPFLLRTKWGIADDKMQSVACSGAQVVADYHRPLVGYLGQDKRLAGSSVAEAQRAALTSFMPGHVPQLEFVKKYQPRIITFTGGGNDIGFANILENCASLYWEDFVPIVNAFNDCGYAVKDSELEHLLRDAIDSQYGYNKRFIHSVKTASPTTKIIMVGYPSFVTDESHLPCMPNSGALSINEIKMMNEMVDYMNSMLRHLAYDTGANYVDITDSLNGGRICEGSEYVTGVWASLNKSAHYNEQFHPNAAGHQQIARAIDQANVYHDSTVPEPGLYDVLKEYVMTLPARLIDLGVVVRDRVAHIVADSATFKPGSSYTVTIHSTPKHLGTFTVKDDGSIDERVSFDGVAIGRHTLVVEGVDAAGNPKRLYQFIEVHATENDADGDGIPNSVDSCQFILEWYDERTGKNVCAITGTAERSKLSSPYEGIRAPSTSNESARNLFTGNIPADLSVEGAKEEDDPIATRKDIKSDSIEFGKQDSTNSGRGIIIWTVPIAFVILLAGGLFLWHQKKRKKH